MKFKKEYKNRIVCKGCGKEFLSRASHTTVCSAKCRATWRWKRGLCTHCGARRAVRAMVLCKVCRANNNKKTTGEK